MYQRATPGQSLRIPAGDWNAAMSAAEAHARSGKGGGRPINGNLPPGCVWARNSYTSTVEQYACCRFSSGAIAPSSEVAYTQARLVEINWGLTHDGEVTRFGIAQEPIGPNKIGVVMVAGVSPIRLTDTYGTSGSYAWIEPSNNTQPETLAIFQYGPIQLLDVPRAAENGDYMALARFPVELGIVPGVVAQVGGIAAGATGTVSVPSASTGAKQLDATNTYATTAIPNTTNVWIAKTGLQWRIVQATV